MVNKNTTRGLNLCRKSIRQMNLLSMDSIINCANSLEVNRWYESVVSVLLLTKEQDDHREGPQFQGVGVRQ